MSDIAGSGELTAADIFDPDAFARRLEEARARRSRALAARTPATAEVWKPPPRLQIPLPPDAPQPLPDRPAARRGGRGSRVFAAGLAAGAALAGFALALPLLLPPPPPPVVVLEPPPGPAPPSPPVASRQPPPILAAAVSVPAPAPLAAVARTDVRDAAILKALALPALEVARPLARPPAFRTPPAPVTRIARQAPPVRVQARRPPGLVAAILRGLSAAIAQPSRDGGSDRALTTSRRVQPVAAPRNARATPSRVAAPAAPRAARTGGSSPGRQPGAEPATPPAAGSPAGPARGNGVSRDPGGGPSKTVDDRGPGRSASAGNGPGPGRPDDRASDRGGRSDRGPGVRDRDDDDNDRSDRGRGRSDRGDDRDDGGRGRSDRDDDGDDHDRGRSDRGNDRDDRGRGRSDRGDDDDRDDD